MFYRILLTKSNLFFLAFLYKSRVDPNLPKIETNSYQLNNY